MNITITLFARARDLAGTDQVQLVLPENATVLDLRKGLSTEIPQLSPIASHLFIAINEEYANDDVAIPAEATIVCFPPVSGG